MSRAIAVIKTDKIVRKDQFAVKVIHQKDISCPRCQSDETAVKDSRIANGTRRRRRLCAICGHAFTTYEIPAETLEIIRSVMARFKDFGGMLDEMRKLADSID